MQWIERIVEDAGHLRPLYVDAFGMRTVGSMRHSRLPRRGYLAARITDASLAAMAPVDPREYLDAIGVTATVPGGHEVFGLPHEGRVIHIPAVVLLSSLFGRMSAIGDRLLQAASLDQVATPCFDDGKLRVKFHRKSRLTQDSETACVQARFVWLTCYPSAKRTWSSVYAYASQGKLSLRLPAATLSASVAGHRTSDAVYATSVSISSLVPTETALPFAQTHAPRQFGFQPHSQSHANKLAKFRASGAPRPGITRAELPLGPKGWAMTAHEWAVARQLLKQAGYESPTSVQGTIDVALEKLGAGQPWSTMGPRWRSVQTVYQHWRARGQWQVFLDILRELRSGDTNACPIRC
jgi:hypothetical protein